MKDLFDLTDQDRAQMRQKEAARRAHWWADESAIARHLQLLNEFKDEVARNNKAWEEFQAFMTKRFIEDHKP